MNKQQLHAALNGRVSRSAIVPTGDAPGTYKIVGKFGEIEPLDGGMWDVWLTDTSTSEAILSERKLTGMLNRAADVLESHKTDTSRVNRLTGEAWVQTYSKELVVSFLPILKVRRAPQLSDTTKQALRERLAELREAA